jgi:hypothetical protein
VPNSAATHHAKECGMQYCNSAALLLRAAQHEWHMGWSPEPNPESSSQFYQSELIIKQLSHKISLVNILNCG